MSRATYAIDPNPARHVTCGIDEAAAILREPGGALSMAAITDIERLIARRRLRLKEIG